MLENVRVICIHVFLVVNPVLQASIIFYFLQALGNEIVLVGLETNFNNHLVPLEARAN